VKKDIYAEMVLSGPISPKIKGLVIAILALSQKAKKKADWD